MKMLQETLALPPGQATTTAAAIAAAAGRARDLEASGHASADPHGQPLTGPRHNSLLEAWRQSAGVGSTGDPEVPPFGKPRAPPARVPHEVRANLAVILLRGRRVPSNHALGRSGSLFGLCKQASVASFQGFRPSCTGLVCIVLFYSEVRGPC